MNLQLQLHRSFSMFSVINFVADRNELVSILVISHGSHFQPSESSAQRLCTTAHQSESKRRTSVSKIIEVLSRF